MDSEEARRIAGVLTKAQRRVLCELGRLGTDPYGHSIGDLATSVATPNTLCMEGLSISSHVYGGPISFNITDRGLAVRAVLLAQGERGE